MSDISNRLAKLSPDQRKLLIQQLKQKGKLVAQLPINLIPDLIHEAVLDPTIQPDSVIGEFTADPDTIFLTGATGFLGAFLLHELLQHTSARIYCLVRAPSLEKAHQRLQQNQKSYGIWHSEQESRVIPILGDLAKPKFGLSDAEFDRLAQEIDVIYHSAAALNFVFPYQALKPVNVLGTQEVLRLACAVKRKTLHYMSSFAVFEAKAYANQMVYENDPIQHYHGIALGYSQSKWVAEKLVSIAQSRGLPTCIYRLPFLSGHSQTGVGNGRDFNSLMINGCIQMGTAPDLDLLVTFSPIDYVSRSIVYLAQRTQSANRAFHLVNPNPLPLAQLTKWGSALGSTVKLVPYQQWQQQLDQSATSPTHPLFALKPFFLQAWTEEGLTIPELYVQSRCARINCQATLAALAGSNITCPPIRLGLIITYFADYARRGSIPLKPWQYAILQTYTWFRSQLHHCRSLWLDRWTVHHQAIDRLRATV